MIPTSVRSILIAASPTKMGLDPAAVGYAQRGTVRIPEPVLAAKSAAHPAVTNVVPTTPLDEGVSTTSRGLDCAEEVPIVTSTGIRTRCPPSVRTKTS